MILCCGEALIDMLPRETKTGEAAFAPHAGGAIFNTAIALGRLGAPAGMLTGLSSDMFGALLKDGLAASDVDTGHLIISDRPTTLAFVKLVEGHASYSFYDENSAGRMLQAQDLPQLSGDVSALYFGGISLACEPAADAYAALQAAHAGRLPVMIDPNIRPGFIADEARYRDRLAGMIAGCDIMKVSDEDLHWLIPGDSSAADKARGMLDRGPQVVVLTEGAQGARAFLKDGRDVQAAAQKVDVVDTVGAGDTFNAGVLADLAQQGCLSKAALASITPEQMKRALQFGARVAAVTVSRAGANPPWASEL
ncbi:MAG: carbohydrate kinase [Pseudomonadota bacterium]